MLLSILLTKGKAYKNNNDFLLPQKNNSAFYLYVHRLRPYDGYLNHRHSQARKQKLYKILCQSWFAALL